MVNYPKLQQFSLADGVVLNVKFTTFRCGYGSKSLIVSYLI